MHSVTEPDYWWDAVESRFGDRRLPLMLLALAFAGAFGIAFACEIGVRYLNTDWNYGLGYSVQRGRDWQPFFALWAGVAIAPIVQGLVGVALLKNIFAAVALAARRHRRDHRFDPDVRHGSDAGVITGNSAFRRCVPDQLQLVGQRQPQIAGNKRQRIGGACCRVAHDLRRADDARFGRPVVDTTWRR